jgi:hypothetical protein
LKLGLKERSHYFFCDDKHRNTTTKYTKALKRNKKYSPALMQLDDAGDDERCRWRAAAPTPHKALDPEPPEASGKSPITDPKGSTPEVAVVITPLQL